MLHEEVNVINKYGLHTRAAAKLVSLANGFASTIQIQYHDKAADCKSIMSLILLGLTKGATFTLLVNGEDEQAARNAVIELFQNCFGEAE